METVLLLPLNERLSVSALFMRNDSEIPSSASHKIIKSLTNITFSDKDIGRTIQNLNPNKAHGNYMYDQHSHTTKTWRFCL